MWTLPCVNDGVCERLHASVIVVFAKDGLLNARAIERTFNDAKGRVDLAGFLHRRQVLRHVVVRA